MLLLNINDNMNDRIILGVRICQLFRRDKDVKQSQFLNKLTYVNKSATNDSTLSSRNDMLCQLNDAGCVPLKFIKSTSQIGVCMDRNDKGLVTKFFFLSLYPCLARKFCPQKTTQPPSYSGDIKQLLGAQLISGYFTIFDYGPSGRLHKISCSHTQQTSTGKPVIDHPGTCMGRCIRTTTSVPCRVKATLPSRHYSG